MTTYIDPIIEDDTEEVDVSSMENVDFISYKISMLSRIMDRIGDHMLVSNMKLPLTPMRILNYLHTYNEGRLLSIARNMHMRGSQVSRNMLVLVERNLVSSHPDPSDRRGTIFRLTEEGRKLCQDTFRRARPKQQEIANLLGAKNYRILSQGLDKLILHFGGPVGPARETAEDRPAGRRRSRSSGPAAFRGSTAGERD